MCLTTVLLPFLGLSIFLLENGQIEAKTYYFNINKTNNQYIVHNRIHLNNTSLPGHNISTTGPHLSELRNNASVHRNYIGKNTVRKLI